MTPMYCNIPYSFYLIDGCLGMLSKLLGGTLAMCVNQFVNCLGALTDLTDEDLEEA